MNRQSVFFGKTALIATLVALMFAAGLVQARPLAKPEDTGGARGDGTTDDTNSLQQVLDAGRTIILGSGKTYRITHRLDIVHNNTGIIGDGTATILMGSKAGEFDNQLPPKRYARNAVGVMIVGIANPRLVGVRVRFEGMVDDRIVKAIAVRGCSDIAIQFNDISGFSKASGIIYIGSSKGGSVSYNHIHDSRTNSTTWGQLTGILTDDDDVPGTSNIEISHNYIHDLTVGADFLSKFGYQTDGINTTVRSTDLDISNNRIENIGEGVDTFSLGGRIAQNEIVDAHNYGIKIIHGASHINITDNTIKFSGKGGIVLAAGATNSLDTQANIIVGNSIIGVNITREHDRTNTFGIGLVGSKADTTAVRANIIENNTIYLGGTAVFGIFAERGTGRDNIIKDNHIEGWTWAEYRLDPTSVPDQPE